MTQATMFGPSEKQVAFINSLLDERELEAEARDGFRAALATMDRKAASNLIDVLLKLPKAVTKVPGSAGSKLQAALSSVPKSKYAIPNEDLEVLVVGTTLTGDHTFIEIREYMGNLYMRRLHGSVGEFTRSRLTPADTIAVANVIANDPYRYAKTFGELYSCCGSCGAELTDPISRSLQLGPECRKKFGM
jgi:hypothetical protein